VTPSHFVKMFDACKTGMIALPYGEKTMTICWAVFIQYQRVTDGRTDGQRDIQTDRITISISRVSVLTRDKNWLDRSGKNILFVFLIFEASVLAFARMHTAAWILPIIKWTDWNLTNFWCQNDYSITIQNRNAAIRSYSWRKTPINSHLWWSQTWEMSASCRYPTRTK